MSIMFFANDITDNTFAFNINALIKYSHPRSTYGNHNRMYINMDWSKARPNEIKCQMTFPSDCIEPMWLFPILTPDHPMKTSPGSPILEETHSVCMH